MDPDDDEDDENDGADIADPFDDPEFERWCTKELADSAARLGFKLRNAPYPELVDRLLVEKPYIEGVTAPRGRPVVCSFCTPKEVPAIADSKIRGESGWALMCRDHYLELGTFPGTGSSQVLIDGLVGPLKGSVAAASDAVPL